MPSLRKRDNGPKPTANRENDTKVRKQFNVAQAHEYEHGQADMRDQALSKRMLQFCCNPLNRRYRFRPVVHVKSTLVLLFIMSLAFTVIAIVTNALNMSHYQSCSIEYPSFAMADNTSGVPADWLFWDYPWVTPGDVVCDDIDGCYRDDLVHISTNNCVGFESKRSQDRNEKTKLTGKIKLYYQITPFFQNHRQYALSRNANQLLGTFGVTGRDGTLISGTQDPMTICTPLQTVDDLHRQFGIVDSDGNTAPGYPPLRDDQKDISKWTEIVLYPCGIQAFSVFTDTFQAFKYEHKSQELINPYDGEHLQMNRSVLGEEIPIYSDRDLIITEPDKYFYTNVPDDGSDPSKVYKWMPKQFEGSWEEGSYVENSHFINWMRLSPNQYVYKLYGTFAKTLDEETTIELPMTIKVRNRYDTSNWGAKKYIIVSVQPSWGTLDPSNSIVLVIIACLTMFITLFFTFKNRLQPRKPGDIKYIGAEYQLNL